MEDEGDAPDFLITGDALACAQAGKQGMAALPASSQNTGFRAALFEERRPDLLLWMQSGLADPLLAEAQRRMIPTVLVDAGVEAMPEAGWWPGRTRNRLRSFDEIFAANAAVANQLARLGLPAARIRTTGPLRDLPPPAPLDSAYQTELDNEFSGRPLWLAAHIRAGELAELIQAQRLVSRHAPRLLLVAHLAEPDLRDKATSLLARAHLPHADWDAGEAVNETHQVLLTDDESELPHWLHLAPVTFLGGSLQGQPRLDPLHAAQRGSVLIHGSEHGRFQTALDLLQSCDATSPIGSGAELAPALEALLAPDFAAQKAGAGWHVITEGALATNHLTDLIRNLRAGRHHADA